MTFGNDIRGIEIRQGIAHLIDKSAFTNWDPTISGFASAIDNAEPSPGGGLPTPNPCNWDQSFIESSSNCIVGALGGVAYHLAAATGVNYRWQPSMGSPDFCAAAQHFVNAGLASGMDGSTCVLRSIRPGVTAHTVKLFARDDNIALLDLGYSIAQEICALFGQGFVTGCSPYLTVSHGPLGAFTGVTTPPDGVDLNWGIYTAGSSTFSTPDVYLAILMHAHGLTAADTIRQDPFDNALYFVFNSKFTSIGPSHRSPTGYCVAGQVPNVGAPNYMYLCSPDYDGKSNQMEFAPCVSASGDPAQGQTSPTFANCPGTSSLTGVSAGYQVEDAFGKAVYTMPIWSQTEQHAYLNGWSRVVNSESTGTSNYFTWLGGYNPASSSSSTIRQGFGGSANTLNPYNAWSPYDFMLLSNIYDSLGASNPIENGQYFDWMSMNSQQLPNSQLSYTPPPGTVSTYRFTLRGDIYFQDGTPLTAFDVAFSYLSLRAYGAFQSVGATSMMAITVLSKNQFDINVNVNNGIFTKIALTSLTIIPGRYWTSQGMNVWDSHMQSIQSCGSGSNCYPMEYYFDSPDQFGVLSIKCSPYPCSFPAADMVAAPDRVVPTWDPIQGFNLVGSGPWKCVSISTGSLGGGCSSSGLQSLGPGQSYVFQRFGKGTIPDSAPSTTYFRSASNLALYLWTGDTGVFTQDFVNYSAVAGCYNAAVQPLPSSGSPSGCAHWQEGIGGWSTNSYSQNLPSPVGINQIAAVNRFVGVNWIFPLDWFSTSAPIGIGQLSPVLFEGISVGGTGNPFVTGSQQVLHPASNDPSLPSGSGCSQMYPVGGYDC